MTALTHAQKKTIIETAIRTVAAGGHESIGDVINEVWGDCKALGLSPLDVLNLFLDIRFNKINVTTK